MGQTLRCSLPSQRANDREHGVRLAIGNGLRATVWKEFLQRFGPISISEFYGATEGNAGFINYTGKIGAVGRVNVFLKVSQQCQEQMLTTLGMPVHTLKLGWCKSGVSSVPSL